MFFPVECSLKGDIFSCCRVKFLHGCFMKKLLVSEAVLFSCTLLMRRKWIWPIMELWRCFGRPVVYLRYCLLQLMKCRCCFIDSVNGSMQKNRNLKSSIRNYKSLLYSNNNAFNNALLILIIKNKCIRRCL